MNRNMAVLGMVCCAIWLAACVSSVTTQQRIEERAMGRWDALLSGDLVSAYEYLSPGYRSSVSSTRYQRSLLLQRIRWTSAEYIESSCEEKVCNVRISLGFTVHGALPGVKSFEDTQIVEESWVLVNGAWYFVPKQ